MEGYVIAVSISTTLLVLFLLLTAQETQTGVRVFGEFRASLDARLRDTAFFVRQLNVALLVAHGVRTFVEHLAHEVVQVILAGVHAFERLLVRTMHALQVRRESVKNLHAKKHIDTVVATLRRTFRVGSGETHSSKDSVE